MKTKMTFLFLAMLSVSFSMDQSLDPAELYLQAIRKFVTTTEYQCDFTMTTDCDKSENMPSKVHKGRVAVKNDLTYFLMGDNLGVESKDYSLHISNYDKVIYVSKKTPSQKKEAFLKGLGLGNMDVDVKELKSDDQNRRIRISPKAEYPDPYIEYAEVTIDKGGWLKTMTIYYDKAKQLGVDQKCKSLRIEYSNLKLEVSENQKLKIENYVIIRGNKASAASNYLNYEVISNLNNELK